MNFITVCLDELGDSIEDYLRYNAISTRLSNLEEKDFNEFINSGVEKPTPIVVDHEAQMKEFLKG